jgi:Family of unknown function (DUF6714)
MSGTTLLEGPMSGANLRQQVAHEIREAFATVPYPGDDRICKPGSFGAELAKAFRGKCWSDLDMDTIASFHVDLPVLTPEAFRYYLPAFMLALIFNYQQAGTLPMSLLHNLTPPDAALLQSYIEKRTSSAKHEWVGSFLNRVSVLSSREKRAIQLFLETYDSWCSTQRGERRFLKRAIDFWKAR